LHFLRHHYSQSTQSCLVCRKRYATQASFEQHVTQHLIMPVKFRKMLINAVLAIRTSTNTTQSQSNVVTTIARYKICIFLDVKNVHAMKFPAITTLIRLVGRLLRLKQKKRTILLLSRKRHHSVDYWTMTI
jgi:hypothetical protein